MVAILNKEWQRNRMSCNQRNDYQINYVIACNIC